MAIAIITEIMAMAMILTVTVIMTLMINLHVRIYVHFIWMTKCTFVYFCNQELSNRDFIEDRNSEVRIPSIPTRLCWRISLLPLLFVYLVHLKSTGISKDAEFWRNPPPLRTRKQASTEADAPHRRLGRGRVLPRSGAWAGHRPGGRSRNEVPEN